MKALDTNLPTALRKGAARVDQDGPWSVSVAETPYDAYSYSLYIKTPTHNLTLTRTAMELVELGLKLRQSHPTIKIPILPISPETLPTPPKRKSTFLNTLSRLASPASTKHQRRATNASAINVNVSPTATPLVISPLSAGIPGLPPIPPTTPLTSPSKQDLFSDVSTQSSTMSDSQGNLNSSIMTAATCSATNATSTPNESVNAIAPDTAGAIPSPAPPTPSATSTALAAYLTTISNLPQVRTDRVWKRFVRVRTDDLESVRVERAIKRVRSDLAAHVGIASSSKEKENVKTSGMAMRESLETPEREKGEVGAEHEHEHNHVVWEDAERRTIGEAKMDIDQEEPGHPTKFANATDSTLTQKNIDASIVAESSSAADYHHHQAEEITEDDAGLPATPLADTPSRIPRSQSAEPDKSHRISRSFTSSVPSQSGAESQTGDEESSSSAIAALTGSGKRRGPNGRKVRRSHSRTTGTKEPKEGTLKKSQRKVCIDDFDMMRVLGKGCAGKVLLVKQRSTADLFALKAITKRHVLAHQELQHTLTEQAVLKRMAAENRDPFVVKLWWSFHDKDNLFLVMDFHPGGDLATQLARWGRLGRDRARFYAAEIVEGVEGLHAAGVIYRDLKPENILIGGDGHIVLTDFGLSKEFPRHYNRNNTPASPNSGSNIGSSSSVHTASGGAHGHAHGHAHGFYSSVPGTPQPVTPPWMKPDRNGDMAFGWPGQPIGHSDVTSTFCGTAEYLAPEVIQGLPYSYEVDWWSFGTMLYEMLTGITPFWANNHSDMYVRVLQDELHFPDDRAIDQDTKSLIRGLLQRVPSLRICEPRIKKHPYFSMIDWSHVYYKRYIPPYIPPIDPLNASDTQNFDDTFLDMEPVLDEYNDEAMDTDQEPQTDAERTDGEDSNTTPSQSRSSSIRPLQHKPMEEDVDVFDGYSFKGRHSVLMDDEEEEGSEEGSGEGSEEGSVFDVDNLLDEKKNVDQPSESMEGLQVEEDEGLGPKTPEARPAALPPVSEPVVQTEPIRPSEEVPEVNADVRTDEEEEGKEGARQKSKDVPSPGQADAVAPPLPPKPTTSRQPITARPGRPRKERSGVPALDRYIEEDTEVTEAERDEDDDWDFIEAVDGEDRNGAKGTSLFARGVVDKYRLKVFGKNSTPSRHGQRVASGMSVASQATTSVDSPSPSQRRGRTPLTFRKHPREFLRAKSPRSFTKKKDDKSAGSSRTASNSNTVSATSSIAGILTPSQSMSSNTFAASYTPSLKSKESALSVGRQSQSSDQSNGQSAVFVEVSDAVQSSPQGNNNKPLRKMKLKKYKNNAEKVLSLFSSPRQNQL